ncbi:uncharacterized protein K460DRAFT_283469 [Cucurbitaria berberidis CBS 394.84]|uniref:C2H2-type domain-containing protein n=1 Tax=Cucurbitaria berberidis CBS 394.84 TaxID=1168544 RepID=A0A9P4GHS8_9PLEO|nr:uncharacterized protein K460DRAFT_283469 [Cucurbitaria berberidis CBS 394.84]KAF1846408.1 hypothetical protein K460DRAFT_283469 [Cucurbitaria berberidis CBS 394.84]
MDAKRNNRYALFAEEDENASPKSSPALDIPPNPFLNQVADSSNPWQEVTKRGAPPAQLVHQCDKTLHTKDQTKAALDRAADRKDRTRTFSSATTKSSDTAYDSRSNWCGVCSQKFTSKSALINHMKHTPDHQHYCNLCKRVFKDRNGIKNHVENSLAHEIFCNLCLSAFKDLWGLRNHFENNCHLGHEFACLTCLLAFESQAQLERHLQKAKEHTWCGTCCGYFRNQEERDAHWKKTTKHKHCLQPGCDFDGPDAAALDRHLKRDHFQCEGCKLVLPSQTKLAQHSETCYFALFCSQCGKECAGKGQLALHLEHCYFCNECGYHTQKEKDYQNHMTKHAAGDIPCWGCDAPMRTYSSLIGHLESGTCTGISKPLLCLGNWWYSTLYMDLDIHVQIRTGRINLDELQQWMDGGLLHPFVCRGDDCVKRFGNFSSLVLHCESQACSWDLTSLNLPGLEREMKQSCPRMDSPMG